LELRERGATLRCIVYDDARGMARYEAQGLVSWQSVEEAGRLRLQTEPGLAEALIRQAQPDDPAVLIHSSGTTGKPKGIALRHRNILAGVHNAYRAKAFRHGEEILAYLPMAWVGDFAITMGAGIALVFVIN